jgi:hypothetical protein
MKKLQDPKAFITNKTLDEAVGAILKGMDNMINNFKVEVRSSFQEVRKRFDNVDNRLEKIEADVSFIKDDLNGIKADLSDTVSKKEFNQLKGKVDKYLTS